MPLKVIFSSSVCHKSVLSLLTSRCFQLVECLMCTSRINFIHRQMQFLQLFENSNFLRMDTSHTHMPASKSREDLVNFLGTVLSANSGGELREERTWKAILSVSIAMLSSWCVSTPLAQTCFRARMDKSG